MLNRDAHLAGRWYCPQCGDAANVWTVDGVARFQCRRGHSGPWEPNERSGRDAEYALPDPAAVQKWVAKAQERQR